MVTSLEKHIDATLETIALTQSIKFDSGQLFVTKYFNSLFSKINSLNTNSNIINKLFFKNNNIIKGIYLFGGVGRGKSMIMDLFFHNVDIKEKRRLAFS